MQKVTKRVLRRLQERGVEEGPLKREGPDQGEHCRKVAAEEMPDRSKKKRRLVVPTCIDDTSPSSSSTAKEPTAANKLPTATAEDLWWSHAEVAANPQAPPVRPNPRHGRKPWPGPWPPWLPKSWSIGYSSKSLCDDLPRKGFKDTKEQVWYDKATALEYSTCADNPGPDQL